jgi:hypothetical protein
MSKISTALQLIMAPLALSMLLGTCQAADKSQPVPLAHFRFNGDAKDENKENPEFELKNTQFKDNALFLNGHYEFGSLEDGYRAVCETPKLDYTKFTVVFRFKPEKFDLDQTNLITGGTSSRWFGMNRSAAGNLTITLNNQDFSHEIKDAALEKGKWTTIACGVDVSNRKIVVYLNGKKIASIDLPKDFKLEEIDSDSNASDRYWSFTNYSNGDAFHGLVDELIIFGKMLSTEEFEKIPLRQ